MINSFFRRGKDSLLKESLQTQLVSCVKDVQLDHAHSGRFQSSTEAAEALCTVLEAIFIHGIKETFADKMAIAMGDPDSRPEPNFWPALLVFSHRELIDQIGKLNFISTDIGRCRAWLRTALNEGLLASYLQSMLAQNRALNSFYNRSAYLRDLELMDMFITLISGIEAHSFNLACNSSLFNVWTSQPLLMSGVWSPAMKSTTITSGTDIASSLIAEDVRAVDDDSDSSVVSMNSYYASSLGSSAFDEEEALKIILRGDVQKKNKNELRPSKNQTQNFVNVSNETIAEASIPTEVFASTSCLNSETEIEPENKKDIDSPSIAKNNEEEEEALAEAETIEEPLKPQVEDERQKPKLESYHSLVENYNKTSTTVLTKIPDLQTLLQKFPKPLTNSSSPVSSTNSDIEGERLDFEVVPENADPTDIPDFGIMIQQINKIPTELGLDSQNFLCRSCPENIGVNFRPAKVCGYTGAYFCTDCFGPESNSGYWTVPARVLYNWDFRRYLVSQKAAHFLSQIQLHPLFDLSAINPKIYSAVEEINRVKNLRIQLYYLWAYLLTCRNNAIAPIQRQLWPRDYLYEKLHHYSLSDLVQVSTGALEVVLQRAIDQAKAHVLSCSLCNQKGFICEICNDLKVIFPFDLDSTYRCQDCSAVYHANCLQAGQLCPKCCRIQLRESQAETDLS